MRNKVVLYITEMSDVVTAADTEVCHVMVPPGYRGEMIEPKAGNHVYLNGQWHPASRADLLFMRVSTTGQATKTLKQRLVVAFNIFLLYILDKCNKIRRRLT